MATSMKALGQQQQQFRVPGATRVRSGATKWMLEHLHWVAAESRNDCAGAVGTTCQKPQAGASACKGCLISIHLPAVRVSEVTNQI